MENTENKESVKLTKPALQYGLLAGILLVVVSIIYYLTGQHQHWSSGVVSYLALLGVIIYGIKTFRDELLGGYINYVKGLGLGVLISLFAGIISGLYTLLFFLVIDPELIQTLIVEAEQAMIERSPNISDSELDMAMGFTKFFMNPWFFFVTTIFSTTFFGTIFSLIVAAVFKKESPIEAE